MNNENKKKVKKWLLYLVEGIAHAEDDDWIDFMLCQVYLSLITVKSDFGNDKDFDREEYIKKLCEDIKKARIKQKELHRNDDFDLDDWKLVIVEELGEMIQAFNDRQYNNMEREGVQLLALLLRFNDEFLNKKEKATLLT